MPKIVFIANPMAPRFSGDLTERIRRRFPEAAVWLTERAGHAPELAEGGARAVGPEGTVVACGGDGTFREVASAVERRARVGFVPLGTVNLIARELGIPSSTEEALACVAADRQVEIFGGRCAADGREPGRLFFIGVSAGPDAEAVHWVGPRRKRLLGRYAYASGFMARLLRPLEGGIEVSPRLGTGSCGELLILRAPHYGGAYRISRTLSLERPGLEVVAVRCGRTSVLRFFWRVYRSKLDPLPDVKRMVVDEVSVRLPPHGRFQIDGDAFRASSLRVTAETLPIRVVAPERNHRPIASSG